MASNFQKLAVVFAFVTFALAQIDQTLEPLRFGKDVVDGVLSKIRKSGIFSDDHEFLRRIAWVETHYGERNATFAPNWYGGIWNVPELYLNRTKHANLTSLHEDIRDYFNVEWDNVTWTDLLVPLHSGIASRLYLSYLEVTQNLTIPEKRQEQANLWDQWYNRKDEYNNHTFVNETEGLENSTAPCNGKMDFVMVLDGSGSIGVDNFELCKTFIIDLMTSFNLRGTRLGFLLYSSEVFRIFELDNYLSMQELTELVGNISYPDARTFTNAAILEAISVFNESEPRFGVPKIMAVFTDGASNDGVSNAELAMEAGIVTYGIGITQEINEDEILEIANNQTSNVYIVSSFDALDEFYRRLNQEACKVPQKPPVGDTVNDAVVAGETRYFAFELPEEGLTVFNAALIGNVGGYYSYTDENPSSAIHDGQLKPNGVYIPRLGEAKRAAREDALIPSVYVAITGTETYNEYSIKAMDGDLAVPETTTTTTAPTTTMPEATTTVPPTSPTIPASTIVPPSTTGGASSALQTTVTLMLSVLMSCVAL